MRISSKVHDATLMYLYASHIISVLHKYRKEMCIIIINIVRSMRNKSVCYKKQLCSLVVSVLDSIAVDPRSNPGSGSELLMSEKSQAVYYISS